MTTKPAKAEADAQYTDFGALQQWIIDNIKSTAIGLAKIKPALRKEFTDELVKCKDLYAQQECITYWRAKHGLDV